MYVYKQRVDCKIVVVIVGV